MENNDEFQKLLEEASKIKENNSDDDNYFGKQTYNPMWGKLSIQDDKWIINYNPFDKMRVDKKLMRMDELATSIFLMLKEKYSKNPKSIELDFEETYKTIILVNPNCDADYVLRELYKDGDEIKFKIHTKNKKHYARIMLDKKEKLVKNY
jgi:hypothetical protein